MARALNIGKASGQMPVGAQNAVGSPKVRAYQAAMRASAAEAASHLAKLLSRRIAAYTVGAKDIKTLVRWAEGEAEPRDAEKVKRLKVAYEIALLLAEFDSPATIKVWFIGPNPFLEDESPVDAVREGKLKEALAAAYAFAVSG